MPAPDLSVVVPVMNEADNIAPLVGEIVAALAGTSFEIVYVDDGSSDASFEVLKRLTHEVPSLRVIRHRHRRGQSAAILTGVRASRAQIVATLDGDGQNDPADVPRLVTAYRAKAGATPFLAAGHRQKRQDTWAKRMASRLANKVRSGILQDSTPDTGCGLKVFGREDFLRLPAFDHMHRFLPALILRNGGRVESIPVSHRARARGTSKYGVWDRFWVGVQDLRGVAWLMRRPIVAEVAETIGE